MYCFIWNTSTYFRCLVLVWHFLSTNVFVSIFSILIILEMCPTCCLKILYYRFFSPFRPLFLFWYSKTRMLFSLLQCLATKLTNIHRFSFYSNTFVIEPSSYKYQHYLHLYLTWHCILQFLPFVSPQILLPRFFLALLSLLWSH